MKQSSLLYYFDLEVNELFARGGMQFEVQVVSSFSLLARNNSLKAELSTSNCITAVCNGLVAEEKT